MGIRNWVSGIVGDEMDVIRISSSILNICICGEHEGNYLPIGEIEGARVLLHYKDKNGDIQVWKGDVEVTKDGKEIKKKGKKV